MMTDLTETSTADDVQETVATSTRPQRWMISMIESYQRAFEGRPSPCRFFPSCSSYAHEAVTVHGSVRGGWLAGRRLLRCRPFGPSGFDPVPEAVHPTALPSDALSSADKDD